MKRRELFAALGALFVAPAVAQSTKEVSPIKGKPKSPVYISWDDVSASLNDGLRDADRIYINAMRSSRDVNRRVIHRALPLADLANRPDDAKRIFEQIASSNYAYSTVRYVGFDEPTVIISGTSPVHGDAKVLITQSTIRYTTIKRNGQEQTNDVRNQKVVEFIRALGYEIDGL